MKYILKEVENITTWNEFVDNSPQGTVFSMDYYLNFAQVKYKNFFVYKGSEVKAALSLNFSDNFDNCMNDDLVIYNGIMFSKDAIRKKTSVNYEKFEITDFIIDEIDYRFKKKEMTLSPAFEDLRPFLWHNYHATDLKDKYTLWLKYTSYLNISELYNNSNACDTELFKNMEYLRQRNIREAENSNVSVSINNCEHIKILIKFYEELMDLQKEEVSNIKSLRMYNLIINLIKFNQAVLLAVLDKQKYPMYIIVFVFDHKRAYYLFGAGNPQSDKRFKGTIAFWEMFKFLANQYRIKEIDLEGINSPKRGWFKQSFGGDIRNYFQVNKTI